MPETAVAKESQGRGVGRALLTEFERWAHEMDFREATLTTFRDIGWNAPFYAKLGYQIFEVGDERPGLRGIMSAERALGVDQMPRVAMQKML